MQPIIRARNHRADTPIIWINTIFGGRLFKAVFVSTAVGDSNSKASGAIAKDTIRRASIEQARRTIEHKVTMVSRPVKLTRIKGRARDFRCYVDLGAVD